MTKEELEKYTVDFMNNEANINWAKIDSIMGEMLIKYAEVFQKRIAELEKINADGLSELNHINGDLIIENEKLKKENAELKELVKDKSCLDCNYLHSDLKLTKAKDHIKKLLDCLKQDTNDPQTNYYVCQYMDKAEQFIKDSEVEK